MTKACLVGVNGYAAAYYNAILKQIDAGAMELVAVTSRNQERDAEKLDELKRRGARVFKDFDAMIDAVSGDCELCCIPTGIHMHVSMSNRAMRAGMDVLVEKPLTAVVQDAQAIADCSGETGKFVAVGYQSMYLASTMAVKEFLCSGALGRVTAARCRGLWPRPDSYYERNAWAGKVRVGEDWVLDCPFHNALAHYMNIMCFFVGPTLRESAVVKRVEAELYRARPIQSADTACIRVLTGDDVTIIMGVTHCPAELYGPVIEIDCENGKVVWEQTSDGLVIKAIPTDGPERPIEEPADRTEHVPDMFSTVLRRMSDPETFICTVDIAATEVLIANAAFDASPIHTIADDYLKRETRDDMTFTIIEGIDELLRRSYEEGKLFSELGAPWAIAGEAVDCSGYETFPTAAHNAEYA